MAEAENCGSSWERRRTVKKKLTKVERAARDARHERVLANAQRMRELAERAQAQVEARSSRD